ncbi:MAG: hypothetical protein ABSG97_08990 [Sedimentisphaerales bacterium]|jgi:hypothetical protein
MADLTQENKQMSAPADSLLRGKTAGAIGLIAMLIFALHASTHMVGAGDTWVALACGRHFYNHGVDTNEPFSANSHRQGPTPEEIATTWPDWAQKITEKVGIDTVKYWHPTGWINQNWLTHVIFYWLAYHSPFADGPSLSFNTLMYLKFAIYILTVICVYYAGRVMGAHPALSAALACAAMFIGRSFLDIRPAGFSNLMVSLFMLILALSTYRNYLYIWLIVPATIFWANLHGGYIYVFIALTPVVAIRLLGIFWRKAAVKLELGASLSQNRLPGTTPQALWHTIAAGAAAFAASIILNPFHLTNLTHTFQISISANAEGWRNVHEWWPAFRWDNPVGTGFPLLVMMVVGIGLLVIWVFSRLLIPKQIKSPKMQGGNQQKGFNVIANAVGFASALVVIWATMISFSFTDASGESFLLSGLFVGILWASVLVNVHFIYLILPFGLFALYTADAANGYTGRYIFPFITLPFYCGLFAAASRISKKPAYSPLNIFYVTAAAAVTLLVSAVTVNPFKFALPIRHLLEQFANLHRLWQLAYEANLDITYTDLFSVLYGINAFCIVAWLAAPHVKAVLRDTSAGSGVTSARAEGAYQSPKIDLALLVIAAMTVYMALRSRRFIPIAGYVACPLIALLTDQIIQTVAASMNFRRFGRLTLPRMSVEMQRWLLAGSAAVVIGFGTWWGLKFKNVYIDPWPTETKLTSAFIRMTASAAKPFDACRFITENKMRGNMFNYWTEGGFIAWGQIPDPDGHTPLQLFMDGRAQAAYNYDAYILWSEIMAGGPVVQKTRIRNQNLTEGDYAQIGEWLDGRLKQFKVWVVLMPSNQFDTPFVKGLEHSPSWRIVYIDDKQKLYVDISTPRGLELFKGIDDGSTIYPEKYYHDVMIAHNALVFNSTAERLAAGLQCAFNAFEENPSRAPMQLMQIYYEHYPQIRPQIDAFWKKMLEDFHANKQKYLNSDGYYYRAVGALMAMGQLQPTADKETIKSYERERAELQRMIDLMQYKRW